MLQDPLLQARYTLRLQELIAFAGKEVARTRGESQLNNLAQFYQQRLEAVRNVYFKLDRDLIAAFRGLQERRRIEIMTSAATHALLPLLAQHPPSLRAQIVIACEHYESCFGRRPKSIWLPECAYSPELDEPLRRAGLQWFVTDAHALLYAKPQPRYGLFSPILTNGALAAFGRDRESARQVWSREKGYPGDVRYRDFYRDSGFDLHLDYVKDYLPSPDVRGFTGLKYHAVGAPSGPKQIYERAAANAAVQEHAHDFLQARASQIQELSSVMDRPPVIVCAYDAELFGHWWFEGPEFLDQVMRQASASDHRFKLATLEESLRACPNLQVATPAASTWGEEGYSNVWLNEKTGWIFPHLARAQARMTELCEKFRAPELLIARALKQAARELLLAQASDWPFMITAGTTAQYAENRITEHLLRFQRLDEQLCAGQVDEQWLHGVELQDNLFPNISPEYWRT
jgi:1,4-alpha-glucan branching enzyme